MSLVMRRVAPSPRCTIAMTAATPMITPSVVSTLRIVLRRISRRLISSVFQSIEGLIARAIVTDPAVLLADEPTGNLDSARTAELMRLIAGLNRDRRITIVMVTHDPTVAAYASRLITFRDGLVLSDVQQEQAA